MTCSTRISCDQTIVLETTAGGSISKLAVDSLYKVLPSHRNSQIQKNMVRRGIPYVHPVPFYCYHHIPLTLWGNNNYENKYIVAKPHFWFQRGSGWRHLSCSPPILWFPSLSPHPPTSTEQPHSWGAHGQQFWASWDLWIENKLLYFNVPVRQCVLLFLAQNTTSRTRGSKC